MSIRSTLSLCHSCTASLPRAAVRCPWCSAPVNTLSGGVPFADYKVRLRGCEQIQQGRKVHDLGAGGR